MLVKLTSVATENSESKSIKVQTSNTVNYTCVLNLLFVCLGKADNNGGTRGLKALRSNTTPICVQLSSLTAVYLDHFGKRGKKIQKIALSVIFLFTVKDTQYSIIMSG